jgi:dTDP-L-rhamnose 4-epimerase
MALRFFNVYGSRQALSNPYTGVAAIFLSRLKNANPPLVFEDGRQSRDFIHVSDVARAVVRSVECVEDAWDVCNVCSGVPVTVAEVARALAERLGLAIDPVPVSRYRAGDIRHCIGDPLRACEVLGFQATTTFQAGLDELIAWSARQHAVDRVESSFAELEQQGLVR